MRNTPGEPRSSHPRIDLGRHVASRRTRLGLSWEDGAERAGSTPGHIACVEEQVTTPRIEFLVRHAHALETTVQELTGYATDLFPPGGARAGYRARTAARLSAPPRRVRYGRVRVRGTPASGPEPSPSPTRAS